MSLSPEELFLFQHNGYLIIPRALSRELTARLRQIIRQHVKQRIPPLVCEDPDRPGFGVSGDIPGARVMRLSRVLARDPVFEEAARAPHLLGALTSILGTDVEVVVNRHNHVTLRPPGAASLEWHRDVVNWSRPIVSVILYLEDSTIERGCTWVLPGSHHMLTYQAQLSGHARKETLNGLELQGLPVPTKAMDALILNGLILHASGPNRAQLPRPAVTLGYHAVDELGQEDEPYKLLLAGERVLRHNTPGTQSR